MSCNEEKAAGVVAEDAAEEAVVQAVAADEAVAAEEEDATSRSLVMMNGGQRPLKSDSGSLSNVKPTDKQTKPKHNRARRHRPRPQAHRCK